MQALALLATLAATAAAIPVPAGGPQGPISYPVGTVLNIAVLQPSGNDYLAIDPTSTVPYIKTDSSDTTPPLNFTTVNATDSSGYTGVALQTPGYGLELTDSGIELTKDADMKDFYLRSGALWNLEAPQGFYCEYECCVWFGSGLTSSRLQCRLPQSWPA